MGYHARGNGILEFKPLTLEQFDAVAEALEFAFEYDGEIDVQKKGGTNVSTFLFWDSGRYSEEDALEALNKAAEVAPIQHGEIDYIGDDDCLWRFHWRNGEWHDDTGIVYYQKMVTASEIVDTWKSVIQNCESKEVRDFITAFCTKIIGEDPNGFTEE